MLAFFRKLCYYSGAVKDSNEISGCGEVWYRAWMGFKRPRVRISTLGPKKSWNRKISGLFVCFGTGESPTRKRLPAGDIPSFCQRLWTKIIRKNWIRWRRRRNSASTLWTSMNFMHLKFTGQPSEKSWPKDLGTNNFWFVWSLPRNNRAGKGKP